MGQSGPKTFNVLVQHLESVMFVDEAYTMSHTPDYAAESISQILIFLDQYKGNHALVLAGYKDKMDAFLDTNEGLRRRFPFKINLTAYSSHTLVSIFDDYLKKRHYVINKPTNRDAVAKQIASMAEHNQQKSIVSQKYFPSSAGNVKVLADFVSDDMAILETLEPKRIALRDPLQKFVRIRYGRNDFHKAVKDYLSQHRQMDYVFSAPKSLGRKPAAKQAGKHTRKRVVKKSK